MTATPRRRIPRAWIETLLCGGCLGFSIHCPRCGDGLQFYRLQPPASFPAWIKGLCAGCHAPLSIKVLGLAEPDPACLSDRLPTPSDPAADLERLYRAPAAKRTPPAPPAKPRRSEPLGITAKPCPADTPRHTLAHWAGRGMVPPGLAPVTIAKGHRWAFGVGPRKQRATALYSWRELGMSLGALGLAFPAHGLEVEP